MIQIDKYHPLGKTPTNYLDPSAYGVPLGRESIQTKQCIARNTLGHCTAPWDDDSVAVTSAAVASHVGETKDVKGAAPLEETHPPGSPIVGETKPDREDAPIAETQRPESPIRSRALDYGCSSSSGDRFSTHIGPTGQLSRPKPSGPTYVTVHSMSIFRQENYVRPSFAADFRLLPSPNPEDSEFSESAKSLQNASLHAESLGNMRNIHGDELNLPASSLKSDLTRAISRIHTAKEVDYSQVRWEIQTANDKLGERPPPRFAE